MAWLKVSFPSVSTEAEALVSGGLACLAVVRFAKCGTRVFFADAFLCFGFFIGSSVSLADRRAECIYASSEQPPLVLRVVDLREELVLKAADQLRLSQDVALHRAL